MMRLNAWPVQSCLSQDIQHSLSGVLNPNPPTSFCLLSNSSYRLHRRHLILPIPPPYRRHGHLLLIPRLLRNGFPSSSSSGSGSGRFGPSGGEDPPPSKEDGLQLPVPAAPDAEAGREGGRGEHGEPPHGVAGEAAGVEGRDDEVEEVDGEGKVGDELGPSDEGDQGDGSSRGGK